MRTNRLAMESLLLALVVVVGTTVPVLATTAGHGESPPGANDTILGTTAAQEAAGNDSSVSVTVGRQLATVISVSSDDVRTEFENAAFELSVERGGEEERADAIAERADELRERAEAIRGDYEEATEAYEGGEITTSEYARRLASLNARASNLVSSYRHLNDRARNVSDLELRAAGADLSSLNASMKELSSVTGAGSSALLSRFLGEADGEIELETAEGLTIEIEREGGESSREFERSRDGDTNITVSHAEAFEGARDALSTPEEGRWVVTESKVKRLEGAYEFEFVLGSSTNLTGEAEVRVDGSTGEVYRLEQETERRGEDDRVDEDVDLDDGEDDEHDELAILVAGGAPEPNGTITVTVLSGGDPAANVTVSLNDREIGTTDASGTVQVTLPDTGEVELEAVKDEAEGKLEFEFDGDHARETERVFEKLDVAAHLVDGSVTVEVRFDGDPVGNATVYANDDRVGKTGTRGTVSFAFDPAAHEELELEVVKGEFEAELDFVIRNGAVVSTEGKHDDDRDRDEREDVDDEDGDDGAETGDDADRGAEDDGVEDDDSEDEGDRTDADVRSLAMSVVRGTPEPGATVTVEVRADGEPVEGAMVTVNGEGAGTTGADGTLEVSFPSEDSIDLRAEHGDAEARLEFDFEFEESDETETRAAET